MAVVAGSLVAVVVVAPILAIGSVLSRKVDRAGWVGRAGRSLGARLRRVAGADRKGLVRGLFVDVIEPKERVVAASPNVVAKVGHEADEAVVGVVGDAVRAPSARAARVRAEIAAARVVAAVLTAPVSKALGWVSKGDFDRALLVVAAALAVTDKVGPVRINDSLGSFLRLSSLLALQFENERVKLSAGDSQNCLAISSSVSNNPSEQGAQARCDDL